MPKICCFDCFSKCWCKLVPEDMKWLAPGLLIPEIIWITSLAVVYALNLLEYYAILWSLVYLAYLGLEIAAIMNEKNGLIIVSCIIRLILAICSEAMIIYFLLNPFNKEVHVK